MDTWKDLGPRAQTAGPWSTFARPGRGALDETTHRDHFRNPAGKPSPASELYRKFAAGSVDFSVTPSPLDTLRAMNSKLEAFEVKGRNILPSAELQESLYAARMGAKEAGERAFAEAKARALTEDLEKVAARDAAAARANLAKEKAEQTRLTMKAEMEAAAKRAQEATTAAVRARREAAEQLAAAAAMKSAAAVADAMRKQEEQKNLKLQEEMAAANRQAAALEARANKEAETRAAAEARIAAAREAEAASNAEKARLQQEFVPPRTAPLLQVQSADTTYRNFFGVQGTRAGTFGNTFM